MLALVEMCFESLFTKFRSKNIIMAFDDKRNRTLSWHEANLVTKSIAPTPGDSALSLSIVSDMELHSIWQINLYMRNIDMFYHLSFILPV